MVAIRGDIRDLGPATFGQRFPLLLADPPWWYAPRNNPKASMKQGAGGHYDLLSTEDLCALPMADVVSDRAMLFLWATAPLLPDALRVMTSWGFVYSTIAFAWVKMNPREAARRAEAFLPFDLDRLLFFGPGFYTGSNIELVLLGRRGRAYKHAPGRKAQQVVVTPRGAHSAKPVAITERIEWMYPDVVPRLELFARGPARPGWSSYGLEVEPETAT